MQRADLIVKEVTALIKTALRRGDGLPKKVCVDFRKVAGGGHFRRNLERIQKTSCITVSKRRIEILRFRSDLQIRIDLLPGTVQEFLNLILRQSLQRVNRCAGQQCVIHLKGGILRCRSDKDKQT